ncbi:MAG TPA: HPr(Ser) kinase/phosphatase [Nitrospiraceae bacterium]|nr:HPr(Ser) kinase/phosphatase [Nitrospiraceae bacterium]
MTVKVKELMEQAELLAGRAGLEREITSPQVCEPDLSSSAQQKNMVAGVVHLKPAQGAYLRSLARPERSRLIRALVKKNPACIVVTGGAVSQELLTSAEKAGIPVFKTKHLVRLSRFLVEGLRPKVSLHGVLVEIFGLGTLILGESAIGKSEAALDLVLRGHKLAADDVVVLEKNADAIIGSTPDLAADLLEVRGLGIINVRALYGTSATVGSSAVGLVVELEEWKKGRHYSLLGLRERRYRILGVNIPYLKLPVKPGRTMATLIEVAARNQLLKKKGINAARELDRRLKRRLAG